MSRRNTLTDVIISFNYATGLYHMSWESDVIRHNEKHDSKIIMSKLLPKINISIFSGLSKIWRFTIISDSAHTCNKWIITVKYDSLGGIKLYGVATGR